MDSGPQAQPSSLSTVPAYPRVAVERYLEDANQTAQQLRSELAMVKARRERAVDALDASRESHRLLGQMMVDAQQDLAARRDHAEQAAEGLLARADEEATRIMAAARAQATAVLGGPVLPPRSAPADPPVESASDRDRHDAPPGPPGASGHEGHDAPLAPSPPSPPRTPRGDFAAGWDEAGAGSDPAVAYQAPSPDDIAMASAAPMDLGGPSRWPRWLRRDEPRWPDHAAGDDPWYFSRLRDELRADGHLSVWFETA